MGTQKTAPAENTQESTVARGWPETRFWIGVLGVFIITFVAASILVVFTLSILLHLKPVVIVSGSMEPGLHVGDVVLYSTDTEYTTLEPGNVIIFKDSIHGDLTTIHRIVQKDPQNGWLQTKGDANAVPDSTWVTPELYIGQGRIMVPHVGLATAWLQIGKYVAAFILITLIIAAGWVSRWGWLTRYDPWSEEIPQTEDNDETDSQESVAVAASSTPPEELPSEPIQKDGQL